MTTMLPMAGAGATIHFNRAAFPPKGPDDYIMAGFRAVTPSYLSTLGVPLRRGRLLRRVRPPGRADGRRRQRIHGAAVLPDREALGQRIRLGTEPSPDFPTMEVVGVVGDMKQSFEAASKAEMFVPYGQFPDPILSGMSLNTSLVVRTAGDPADLTASVRGSPAVRTTSAVLRYMPARMGSGTAQ